MKQMTVIRKNLGLTQKELAGSINVRVATISQIETGETKSPRVDTMQKIAEKLGHPIEVLLRDIVAA